MSPTNTPSPKPVPPGLVYKPHAALFCWLSDHRPIRTGVPSSPGSLIGPLQEFCSNYKKDLERYLKEQKNGGGNGPQELSLSYLNPVAFATLGASDLLATLLVDDFDPMLRLASEPEIPIDQLHLALCPDLKHLGIKTLSFDIPVSNRTVQPFLDFEDFNDLHRDKKADRLLVVTRLKVGGLGALGRGSVLQRAIFLAASQAVIRSCKTLTQNLNSTQVQDLAIKEKDLQDLRCCLLEGQGAESVLLLTSCSNLSLAFSVIAELRGLTYRHMYEADEQLGAYLNEKAQLDEFLTLFHNATKNDHRGPGSKVDYTGFSANHVFASSTSTVAIALSSFDSPGNLDLRGYVEAQTRVATCPGHEKDTQALLREKLTRSPPDPTGLIPHRLQVGNLDLTCTVCGANQGGGLPPPADASGSVSTVETKELFCKLRAFLDAAKDSGKACGESGFLTTWTSLVVPVPNLNDGLLRSTKDQGSGNPHIPVLPVLQRMGQAPFQAVLAGKEQLWHVALRDGTRRLLLPVTLCRNIEVLFKKYVRCLENPLLFESVLDLHDTMEALYTLFLPGPPINSRPRLRITEAEISELSQLVQAIHNAIGHRINARPSADPLDWIADFRGSLNRLVLALDAPMKSGIGLLKWCWENVPGLVSPEGSPAKQATTPLVGAITRLAMQPRPLCQQLLPASGILFARVDMNVSLAFHPSQLITYLHEAAHFVFQAMPRSLKMALDLQNALMTEDLLDRKKFWESPAARFAELPGLRASGRDREEELFAEFLTMFLVFGGDWRLYRVYTLARFFCDTLSKGTAEERKSRVFETLLRIFLVSAPVRLMVWPESKRPSENEPYSPFLGHPAEWDLKHPWEDHYNTYLGASAAEGGLDAAGVRSSMGSAFKDFCIKYQPIVEQHLEKEAIKGQELIEFLTSGFDKTFWTSLPKAIVLWRSALEVYKAFANVTPWRDAKARQELHEKICRALRGGEVNVEALWSEYESTVTRLNPGPRGQQKSRGWPSKLLELVLISQILYAYSTFCFQGIRESLDGKEAVRYFTTRDPMTGQLSFMKDLGSKAGYCKFLFDTRYGGQICMDPATRSSRMRHKIGVLKALEDLSCRQRARRFASLLEKLP